MYLLRTTGRSKRDGGYLPPLQWKDFRVGKTDFNIVSILAQDSANRGAKSRRNKYTNNDVQSDLTYYKETYDA